MRAHPRGTVSPRVGGAGDGRPQNGAVPSPVATTLAAEATSRTETLTPGSWRPAVPDSGLVGVVRDGLLAREVAVGPTSSAELLGPGDVLLVPPSDQHLVCAAGTHWSVVHPGAILWLNGTLHAVLRSSPSLAATLLFRAQRRIDHLAFSQSVAQLTRVDDRVLAMLWHLAERWGRVTAEGVVVDLALTHRVLGRLVGARRPSVTTALGALTRDRVLERREDGSWLLLTAPPEWWHTPRPVESLWED
jgi:CRP/FNR family transcriptional regulator, cyclic AMP receptor protein